MAAAIARVFIRTFPPASLQREVLMYLALFCGAGLVVSLLFACYGVDLNVAGF
jgi:hypothetical protein